MAVAHQMLTVIYHMLRHGTPYREPGEGYYDEKRKPEITRRLVKRLQRLGYQVTLEVAMTPEETLEASEAIPEASEAIPALPEVLPTTRRRGRPCKCTERGLPCRHRAIPAERRATEINSQTIPSDPGVRPMSSH
jgi:hypothetical protein